MKWQLTSPVLTYDRDEDSVVVLSISSGNTYLVSRVARNFLKCLELEPNQQKKVLLTLASQLSSAGQPDAEECIEELLRELEQIHLIELC